MDGRRERAEIMVQCINNINSNETSCSITGKQDRQYTCNVILRQYSMEKSPS
jgi:hypothetical protein